VSERIEANVPARALQEATRVADGHDTITITLAERQIPIAADETLHDSRQIDGQFTD
jgi:DNA polymerase III sliding clamp (beta) subunit (PCNA family)